MKKNIQLLAILAGLTALSTAQAGDNGWYGSVGGGVAQVNISDFDVDASNALIHGALGYDFNKYFGAEMRLGFGVGDDTINFNVGATRVSSTVSIDNYVGLLAKASLPIGDAAKVYGLFGTSTVGSTVGTEDTSDNGLSFGVGAQVNVTNDVAFNLEWARLVHDSDGVDFDAITGGLIFKF